MSREDLQFGGFSSNKRSRQVMLKGYVWYHKEKAKEKGKDGGLLLPFRFSACSI